MNNIITITSGSYYAYARFYAGYYFHAQNPGLSGR